jgi:Protein of unknown function (DUF3298)/Deacetylase PdaC
MLKTITIIFLATLLMVAACTKSQVETNAAVENNSAGKSSAGSSSSNESNTKKEENIFKNPNVKTFRGMINGIEFQMNLTREGDKLSGSYFYSKIGKDLKLSGSIDKADKFSLDETDESGKKTGEWSGTWKYEENTAGITLDGNWKKSGSKDELGFYAVEQIIEFTGDVKFTNKTIKEKDTAKHSEINAVYPEISGVDPVAASKFNKLVKKLVTDSNDSYKKDVADFTDEEIKNMPASMGLSNDVSYDNVWASNDFVSLIFSDFSFLGGAHGSQMSTTVNYDLKNNRELELKDVFEPNSDYLKMISDYSIADLKKLLGETGDNELVSEGAGAKAENFRSWNLTKKGLMITFDAYQVASYADGPQTVIIPYSKLKPILRKDGIAANFAK